MFSAELLHLQLLLAAAADRGHVLRHDLQAHGEGACHEKLKTLHTGALRLQIFDVVSASGVLGQQPVQQEQAEGDEDDHLGDGHVRRVLAPHPGQTRKRCLTIFLRVENLLVLSHFKNLIHNTL